MLYQAPQLTAADDDALGQVAELQAQVAGLVGVRRRWYGTLRRATFARSVQGSNSIEGYHASVEEVAAVIDDEASLEADDETRAAIAGYRDAMTYVLQLAGQPLTVDLSLLRALHFMMIRHDLAKHPGQWRPGAIWVEDSTGAVVYEAPDRDQIEPLVSELVEGINRTDGPLIVRAAMAHLNLTLIHPFSDGNGRMARCLESLVLGSTRELPAEFLSIEEYLGRHTPSYYGALAEVAQGRWSPERSARPYVRLAITAHYRQALTTLERIRDFEALWAACDQLAQGAGLPDRTIGPLCDAARGWRLRRSQYVKQVRSTSGEVITDATATRDLVAMAKAGLLVAQGERRGRSYMAADHLRAEWAALRRTRPVGPASPYTDDPA